MVKVAAVTAHAMYFRFPLFLHHHQVMELEAVLVVGQVDLAVQEVPEVHRVQKEHQDHQRRKSLVDMDNWSHLLLRSQV